MNLFALVHGVFVHVHTKQWRESDALIHMLTQRGLTLVNSLMWIEVPGGRCGAKLPITGEERLPIAGESKSTHTNFH